MNAVTVLQPSPHLVVFGRDAAGKPHASWFDQASVELATKAARLMNMHAVPVETEVLRELAGHLPKGRVFSSGRAFTPFIKGTLYKRLVEGTRDILGLSESETADAGDQAGGHRPPVDGSKADGASPQSSTEAQTAADIAPALAPINTRPIQSDDITIGSMLLALSAPAEGWYEAQVLGLNGASVTLRYVDYPEEGTFVRRRTDLGFLPPAQG